MAATAGARWQRRRRRRSGRGNRRAAVFRGRRGDFACGPQRGRQPVRAPGIPSECALITRLWARACMQGFNGVSRPLPPEKARCARSHHGPVPPTCRPGATSSFASWRCRPTWGLRSCAPFLGATFPRFVFWVHLCSGYIMFSVHVRGQEGALCACGMGAAAGCFLHHAAQVPCCGTADQQGALSPCSDSRQRMLCTLRAAPCTTCPPACCSVWAGEGAGGCVGLSSPGLLARVPKLSTPPERPC